MSEIKKKFEEIVAAEYKAYGYEGRAEVTVNDKGNVTVYLNHEVPYMGNQFWEFIRTLNEKLSDEYEKTDGKYFYSYYIMDYVKK